MSPLGPEHTELWPSLPLHQHTRSVDTQQTLILSHITAFWVPSQPGPCLIFPPSRSAAVPAPLGEWGGGCLRGAGPAVLPHAASEGRAGTRRDRGPAAPRKEQMSQNPNPPLAFRVLERAGTNGPNPGFQGNRLHEPLQGLSRAHKGLRGRAWGPGCACLTTTSA